MRQADKNRAEKAYDLVAQAEKKLREIKWENMNEQQSYLRQQALNKFQELRWAIFDFKNKTNPNNYDKRRKTTAA